MVWRENAWRELTCPACLTTGLMPKRLDANPPYKPRERYNLFQCESCQTLHYPDAEVFEYESRRDADLARKFYLEVGAGLDAMIAPLAWAARGEVGTFLEVGGGYGFSVGKPPISTRHSLPGRARRISATPIILIISPRITNWRINPSIVFCRRK